MKIHILDTMIANHQNNEVYPQVEHMGAGYDWHADDSVTKIQSNTPLPIRPNLHSFHLRPQTRFTDIVSESYTTAVGMLVSKRLAQMMEQFVLPKHEQYEAEVVLGSAARPYIWLHFVDSAVHYVDFDRSRFCVVSTEDYSVREVSISGIDELNEKSCSLVNDMSGRLRARSITFVRGTPPFDLIWILLTSPVFFVSEKFAAELIRCGMTGFQLIETETVLQFSVQ